MTAQTVASGHPRKGAATDVSGMTTVRTLPMAAVPTVETSARVLQCVNLLNPLDGPAHLTRRHPTASVYVVDDDCRVSTALSDLFAGHDMTIISLRHAQEFLEYRRAETAACLLLNFDSIDHGVDQATLRLHKLDGCCPIIYISDHGNVPGAVSAIRAGAVDFLTKPLDTGLLLRSIETALDSDVALRTRAVVVATLQRHFSTLSARERQVLPLVIGGMRNKQAAAALGISEVTLQVHRSQIMHKMGARSFAELIRIGIALGVAAEPPPSRHSWVWQTTNPSDVR